MSAAITSEQFDLFQQLMKLGITNDCSEQTLEIMNFLRHAVSPTVEMVLFEAWQMISAGRLPEARRLLEEAVQNNPDHGEVKALLAAALFFAEDELWHAYAYEVEQSPQPDEAASGIVAKLKEAADSGLSVELLHGMMLHPAAVARALAAH